MAFIMFGYLALSAFGMDYIECENQPVSFNVTSANYTVITNEISCIQQQVTNPEVGFFFGGMAMISGFLTLARWFDWMGGNAVDAAEQKRIGEDQSSRV